MVCWISQKYGEDQWSGRRRSGDGEGGWREEKGEEMQNEFNNITLCACIIYAPVNSTSMYIYKTPTKNK